MNWDIRKALLSDVDALTELRMELLTLAGDVNETNRPSVARANKEYFENKLTDGSFSAWVAESNGIIVSMSGLVFFERPPQGQNMSGLEGYIMNMYTMPEYRGKQIARALLEKCIADCRRLGAGRVWLHSSRDGYHLYKSTGFTKNGSEMELLL